MAARTSEAADGEELFTRERKVSWDENSARTNLTAEGRDVLGLDPDKEQRVELEIYPDGIWIETVKED